MTWQKHSFPLLLYLEWVLLAIVFLTGLNWIAPHPHRFVWLNGIGISSAIALGIMGLRLPANKFWKYLYTAIGFLLSWSVVLFLARGERAFPALLLIVTIRGCLLFSLPGRIAIAIVAFNSFLAVQIMSLTRFSLFNLSIGRPLPRVFRRLPATEFRQVLLGFTITSALLFALVLTFVILAVSALIAERNSKAKLVQANRRLQEYALQVADRATLAERNRIAREIHDSVGHYLTAQSIQLENTALFLESDRTKAATYLAKARQLSKDALLDIRKSVAALRSNSLPVRSLIGSLIQAISNFEANTNIEIDRKLDLTATATPEISLALYRVLQEALTNIAKHSQATKVEIILQATNNKIELTIRDNGCGFNPSQNTTGFGIQGMYERIAALNGELSIVSQSDRGSIINIKVKTRS